MIVHIREPDDPRLASYRHVGDHGWLAARGLFVAEGRLVVERAIRLGTLQLESALVTPPALRALEALWTALHAPVFVIAPSGMQQVTGFNFHRGCLALVHRPSPPSLETVCARPLLLGIEGVGNPDNLGGLFRTAAAFGAGVILDATSGDPFYRKAVRTSMGAVLGADFTQVTAWPAALERMAALGFSLVALTPHASATSLEEFAASVQPLQRVALLVGSEGTGLGPAALAGAHHRVRIPLTPVVESLNVVVAAGVALWRLAEVTGSIRP